LAILIGFGESVAIVWRVYSQVIKFEATVNLNGTRGDVKVLYNFHEALVNSLRVILGEGVRSVILVSPPRTTYGQTFAEHIKEHHAWLTQGANKIVLTEITGTAVTRADLASLAKRPDFREIIQNATFEETENLLELLEKRLNSPNQNDVVMYSLEGVEQSILNSHEKLTFEFLLLTNEYLAKTHDKRRLNRLMQIATNRKVKTRVVNSSTPTGKRLAQLGGIVLLAKRS
jgi:stalled ribosome rescue protein Dom34